MSREESSAEAELAATRRRAQLLEHEIERLRLLLPKRTQRHPKLVRAPGRHLCVYLSHTRSLALSLSLSHTHTRTHHVGLSFQRVQRRLAHYTRSLSRFYWQIALSRVGFAGADRDAGWCGLSRSF